MRPTRPNETVFDDLAGASGEDLISVFIPTHRAGRQVAQDPIHLKNGLSAVEETLTDLGWKPRERSERLAAARDLLDDLEFWEHQDSGLAVYIDDSGEVTAVSSSRRLDPFSTVMPVFMVRPLVADIHPVVAPVLALTMDEVALFEATESSATEMDVDLPAYEDVNWFVDRETQQQQHPDQQGSTRNRHGHRNSTKSDEDFARFLREVDGAIKEFESDTPLIVVGDDDMVARFANQSELDTVSPKNSGIAAPFSTTTVHEMVVDTISRMSESRAAAAREHAIDQLGMGLGATTVEAALPEAVSGRVGRVVIHRQADPVWGRLNEGTLEVDTHDEKRPGDVDLIDRLVVWSRSNGATVVSSETPIDDRPFIAVYRY